MNTANDTSHISLTIAQEFSHLISNIAAKELDFFADNNIEILHDLRVDLRKLRSWLKIIKKAGYPVKELLNHSVYCHSLGGELRNFDVLVHWIHTNKELVSPKLRHQITKQRKKLKKVFLKELVHHNPLQKLRLLGRSFLPHLKGITKSDLQSYVEHYLKIKREHLNHILLTTSGDLEQLHNMRKTLKKIRYTSHFLPSIDLKHLDSVKELQNILGYINDRRVWIALMKSYFKKNKEASSLVDIFKKDIKNKIDEFKVYTSESRF